MPRAMTFISQWRSGKILNYIIAGQKALGIRGYSVRKRRAVTVTIRKYSILNWKKLIKKKL